MPLPPEPCPECGRAMERTEMHIYQPPKVYWWCKRCALGYREWDSGADRARHLLKLLQHGKENSKRVQKRCDEPWLHPDDKGGDGAA